VYAKIQDSIIMQQKHMIEKYIVVTGVQSQKAEDVESLYNLKQQISLDEQQEKLNKETVRKKRWRNISIATASAVILESAVIYFLVR
jgi:U3 small nucleolar ribonucleoprotein component